MSWYLARQDEEGHPVLYLVQGSVCRVGRSSCELVIPDATVSRHHADIEVTEENKVRLTDRSKFCQTMLNGRMLKAEKRTVDMRANDFMSFGSCSREYKLVWKPIVLLTDTDVIAPSGLVLSSIFRSDAVACIARETGIPGGLAAASSILGIPLISESFLHAFTALESGATSLPQFSDFAIREGCGKRSELLLNVSVYFKTDKDQQEYEKAVRLAGGKLAEFCSDEEQLERLYVGYKIEDVSQFPCLIMSTEQLALGLVENTNQTDLLSRAVLVTEAVTAEQSMPETSQPVIASSDWITPLRPSNACDTHVVRFSTEEENVEKKHAPAFEKIKRSDNCEVKLKRWTSGNGRNTCEASEVRVSDENDLFGIFPSHHRRINTR